MLKYLSGGKGGGGRGLLITKLLFQLFLHQCAPLFGINHQLLKPQGASELEDTYTMEGMSLGRNEFGKDSFRGGQDSPMMQSDPR